MLSVTLLSSYLYCKRKLFLERVLRIVEPPKEVLILGSLRHECYDLINKTEEKIVKGILKQTNIEELKQIYKTEFALILRNLIIKYKTNLKKFDLNLQELFKRYWPSIMRESSLRAVNLHKFMKINKIYGEELWDKLTPKIHSEYYVKSDELGLKGIIDKLEIHENDFIPFELKTGRSPKTGVWDSHKVQMASYLLLLNEKFKKDITIGFIKYLDIDEERAVILNPFLKDNILALRDKVKSLLNSKEIPNYCNNENKCKVCGLKEECFDEKLLNKKVKLLS